jgi:hypothetical protein
VTSGHLKKNSSKFCGTFQQKIGEKVVFLLVHSEQILLIVLKKFASLLYKVIKNKNFVCGFFFPPILLCCSNEDHP